MNAAVEFGVPVEESNLTDFLKVPNVFSYVAADIFQFNESQVTGIYRLTKYLFSFFNFDHKSIN